MEPRVLVVTLDDFQYLIEELKNRAADIPEGGSVEVLWSASKDVFIITGDGNDLGELRTQGKQWIANDTWRKKEERRNAKAVKERAKSRGVKAVARQHHSAETFMETGQKNVGGLPSRRRRESHKHWRHPSPLSGTKMNATMPVKNTSGQLWTNFVWLFEVLATPSTPQHDPPRLQRITRVNTESPSVQETETIIHSMKSNRAPGIDRIDT